MNDEYSAFSERQEREWALGFFNDSIFDNNKLARVASKISPSGIIQSYQGVTSVFPVIYTNLSAQLASLSDEIYESINRAKLFDLVYQLPHLTHHMTVADIAPNSDFNPEESPGVRIPEILVNDFREKITCAFDQIRKENITEITGQISGIGANVTIAFRVDFQPEEFSKIYKIEKIIKYNTGINIRPFPGIISAFLMKPNTMLTEYSQELINSLIPFENLLDRNLIITFSDLYYTLFRSMIDYKWLNSMKLLKHHQ